MTCSHVWLSERDFISVFAKPEISVREEAQVTELLYCGLITSLTNTQLSPRRPRFVSYEKNRSKLCIYWLRNVGPAHHET